MTLASLISFCRPHSAQLIIVTALMISESLVALSIPWLGGQLANDVIAPTNIAANSIIGIVLALLVLQAALRILQGVVLTSTSQALLARLRNTIYSRLLSLPLGFLRTRKRGDLLTLVSYETQVISDFVTGTLVGLLPRLLTLIGALVLMIDIDPILALPAAICIPAFFVSMKLAGRRMRPLAHNMQNAFAASVAYAEEGLALLPALKAFVREDYQTDRYSAAVHQTRKLAIQLAQYQAVLAPLTQLITASALVVMLWFASDQVSNGDMSPGTLIAFLLYAALLTRPIAALADTWGRVQQLRGVLTRLSTIMTEPPEQFDTGITPNTLRGEVFFDAVQFSYPDRAPCLVDVSLRIAPGETLALTGPNGLGKTTLVDLLLRFHAPGHGRIMLDGIDISTLKLGWLRDQIAVVPQQLLLFDGTLRENILFGRADTPPETLARALDLARVHDVIATLPKGLDTRIGEKGQQLSGGQQQRVALARALVKEPRILVLDEPTAMFDPEAEAALVAGLTKALASCSVILITHRPESLALADRIVTLNAGQIENT